jgi:hypothetical protein
MYPGVQSASRDANPYFAPGERKFTLHDRVEEGEFMPR